MTPLPPTLSPVARLRPVSVVQAGTDLPGAPYLAVETAVSGATHVALGFGEGGFRAIWDGRDVYLEVTTSAKATSTHRSRRFTRGNDPTRLAVSLTGPWVTAWVAEDTGWVARAVVDLAESAPNLDAHDPAWLATVQGDGESAGAFGQLGLRDLRLVTHADGTPYREAGTFLLTATSAGPGGFRSGHCSVWAINPSTMALNHRADLFFSRPGGSGRGGAVGVFGDHAVHLIKDDDRWLVAASTWGDFDKRRHPKVGATLATSTDDLLVGQHMLEATPLALPTDGLASVGTWDPHLVRTDGGWLATYVSARRFFEFYPVTASGPSLDALQLRAAATERTATEGPTLAQLDGRWRVLASDGRDGPRRHRAAYPVFDLDLQQLGQLDAFYPTNLPWPTVFEHDNLWWMLGFDATTHGGSLLGYGTHGDVVVQASGRP